MSQSVSLKYIRLLPLVIIFILCQACLSWSNNTKQKTGKLFDVRTSINIPPPYFQKIEGAWIIPDYWDNMIQNKSIAKVYGKPDLSFYAFGLFITKDSIYTLGSLYGRTSEIKWDNDTLLSTFNFEDFLIQYDRINDQVIFETTRLDTAKGYFRRVHEDNLNQLLKAQAEGLTQYEILEKIYQIMVDSILVGKYRSLDNGEILTLNSDGTTTGFKNYTRYGIHDYTGTSHPTYPHDAIFFDATDERHGLYNWEFKGNHLILTEMTTHTGGDSWVLGKRKFNFIKQE